jgi:hypothetical protein
MVWDDIKDIPQPNWEGAWVTSARYIDGKLYVATHGIGLQVFDPKTETWKGYAPEQGLPSRDVDEFFPLGRQVLYCTANRCHFTLNVADGAVVLVHRPDPASWWATDWPPGWKMCLVWRKGGQVMGIDEVGMLVDLLGKVPQRLPLASLSPYGWPADFSFDRSIVGTVEAEGRLFCLRHNGLCEVDAAGKTLHAWMTTEGEPCALAVVAPADCPIPPFSRTLRAAGSRLVITGLQYLVVYDAKTDTWCGPINAGVGGDYFIATPHAMLWDSGATGLNCLALDEAVAYAKSIGRAMTTAEFRRRKQQLIDAATPLDRAKFNIGMRQFDRAKAALRQVLDAEPNQAEALILMGFLHDHECLNQLDEAVKYYQRAAALEDNPNGSFSGMYLWMRLLEHRQQWQGMLDLCEKTLQRYPLREGDLQRQIESLRDSARRQLAENNAKQPAPATSNKEERPAR